jgi:hypothetical protein
VPQGKWAIFESDGSVESNTRFLLALHELSFRGPGSASTKNVQQDNYDLSSLGEVLRPFCLLCIITCTIRKTRPIESVSFMCNTNTTRPYQLAINHYAHYAATSLKLNMNGTKHARSFWTQGNFQQVISNFQYIYMSWWRDRSGYSSLLTVI